MAHHRQHGHAGHFFFSTGKLKLAPGITGVEFFTKLAPYYFHERVREKLSFGRLKEAATGKPNFEI